MNFITDTFESQIKDVIRNLFYKLNNNDFEFINSITVKLIDHLASCYGFKREEKILYAIFKK